MYPMRAIWLTLLVAFAALNAWALASAGWEGVVTYFTPMGPIDLVAAVSGEHPHKSHAH